MSAFSPASSDIHIVCALIDQVTKAVPPGRSEQAVTTWISRPLWERFMRFCGEDAKVLPTEWLMPIELTRRVYGSRTIIVESELEFSVSKAT